ncbi:MAG TPA: hypothetical protein VF524_12060, partial [Polyangia bacterium]
MTTPRRVLVLLALVAAWASGCSANSTAGNGGGRGGAIMGFGGSSTAAGGFGDDSGSPSSADAANRGVLPSNLSADAPAYKWDACVGCPDGRTGGSGGAAGAGAGGLSGGGGKTSTAGAGGLSSVAGSTGRGGTIGSGGVPGYGAAIGVGGGSAKADGGITSDAPGTSPDASSTDLAVGSDVVQRDAGPSSDAAVADLRLADSLPSRCVAQIESVVPATDSFSDFSLVAGPNLQIVLRASVVSGGPATAASWN